MEISQGLPLLMILALDSVREHDDLRWDTQEELLYDHVQRMLAKFQQFGLDARCLPLLALASFTRSLPWEHAKGFQLDSTCLRNPCLIGFFSRTRRRRYPLFSPICWANIFSSTRSPN